MNPQTPEKSNPLFSRQAFPSSGLEMAADFYPARVWDSFPGGHERIAEARNQKANGRNCFPSK
jgi:hypothetical protein